MLKRTFPFNDTAPVFRNKEHIAWFCCSFIIGSDFNKMDSSPTQINTSARHGQRVAGLEQDAQAPECAAASVWQSEQGHPHPDKACGSPTQGFNRLELCCHAFLCNLHQKVWYSCWLRIVYQMDISYTLLFFQSLSTASHTVGLRSASADMLDRGRRTSPAGEEQAQGLWWQHHLREPALGKHV